MLLIVTVVSMNVLTKIAAQKCVWMCERPAGLITEGLVQDKFVAPSLLIHPRPAGLEPLMKPTKVNQLQ